MSNRIVSPVPFQMIVTHNEVTHQMSATMNRPVNSMYALQILNKVFLQIIHESVKDVEKQGLPVDKYMFALQVLNESAAKLMEVAAIEVEKAQSRIFGGPRVTKPDMADLPTEKLTEKPTEKPTEENAEAQ